MLRSQIPDKYADVSLPMRGINLRSPQQLLQPGEAALLQNCYFDGGVRPIPGTRLLTPSALSSTRRISGGHKAYWNTSGRVPQRLVSYGTTISAINDAGSASTITNTMTDDRDTFFVNWPITDTTYISNGIDTLRAYTGGSFNAVSGTNVPSPQGPVVPVLDRMFCIASSGDIEHTNPRSDSVWSNGSSWATFRPVRPGRFVVLHPFSLRDSGRIYPGALAFQSNAFYIITGTDYGSDVTSASPPTGYDASMQLLDPTIGTSSPRGVCTVPGVGVFWVTSELNVYHLPEGAIRGFYVGDNLTSRCDTAGLESCNLAAIDKIQLVYFDRKLILRFPSGTSTYNNREFWLDLRYELGGDNSGPVWYGPMTPTTTGVLWREDQNGELGLYGGEGNAATGAYVYKAYQTDIVSHAQGASTIYPTSVWQDRYLGELGGSTEKYVQRVRMTAAVTGPAPSIGVTDLGYVGALLGQVSAYNG